MKIITFNQLRELFQKALLYVALAIVPIACTQNRDKVKLALDTVITPKVINPQDTIDSLKFVIDSIADLTHHQ